MKGTKQNREFIRMLSEKPLLVRLNKKKSRTFTELLLSDLLDTTVFPILLHQRADRIETTFTEN